MPTKVVDFQKQLDSQRKRVDVDHYDITLRELLRMVDSKELHRSPEYQRKFRWDADDESRLIESLFLGLPVPSIFVATNKDGTWELIDGLQRVSSIIHFTADSQLVLKTVGKSNRLILEGLSKLTNFNGIGFHELSTPIQLHFYKRQIRVTALSDKSDPDVRFDLFERLNAGGVALTGQEVRACIHRGKYSKFLKRMAKTPSLVKLLKLQNSKQHDGTKEELVLRFFSLLDRRDDYTGDLKNFLNRSMGEFAKNFDYAHGEQIFQNACQKILEIVNGPFMRPDVKVTPLNQFEGCLTGIGLMIAASQTVRHPAADWLSDETLVAYSQGGSNARERVLGRIRRAIELLGGKPPADTIETTRKRNRQ